MSNNTQADEPRALVIGDVHGHYDRLLNLLRQEGVLVGDYERSDMECEVIQLGDLGHFGNGSNQGDLACYQMVEAGLIDVLLWGNHDRAIVDQLHEFGGYSKPAPTIKHMIRALEVDGRMKMAHAIHDYLLTHAGLHPSFADLDFPEGLDPKDVYDVADFLNQKTMNGQLEPYINNVSRARGGGAFFGGVLWRDAHDEPIYDLPQIFGHTSREDVREFNGSYCIDTSKHGKVTGVWLPDLEFVSATDEAE